MGPLALFLLCLLPFLIAGNAVSITYQKDSEQETQIQLTSTIHDGFHVYYNFSMSFPLPISVINPQKKVYEYCTGEQFCLFDRYLSETIQVVLNYNDAAQFLFEIAQVNYDYLAVYVDECNQDISTKCRHKNYTRTSNVVMICMCEGMSNFCSNESLPMWSAGKWYVFPCCNISWEPPGASRLETDASLNHLHSFSLDGTIPTDLPVVSDFQLSMFYGISHDNVYKMLFITRNDFESGDFVQFVFDICSNIYRVSINGEICPDVCDPVIIGINETVSITIQDFTINLVQTAANETQVIYGGCTSTLSECRDTSEWVTAYYGCLCFGELTDCASPRPVNESCLGTITASSTSSTTSPTTSLTTHSTTNVTKATTSPLTTKSIITTTTTVKPPPWKLFAFYEVGQTETQKLEIDRTQINTTAAVFHFFSLSEDRIMVNGTDCHNCTETLLVESRLDVVLNGSFHFYLYEKADETVVGIGDSMCDQDISADCRSGDFGNALIGCLCENSPVCAAPVLFNECPDDITPSGMDTTAITTTRAVSFPSLKSLSNSDIGPNNVSHILNETLTFSNKKGNLTSDEVGDISTILGKSANISGLNTTDALLILTNFDNVLYAPYNSFSEESAAQLNDVFQPMVVNTDSSTIEYLDGINLGFSSKEVECNDANQFHGLADSLTIFSNQQISSTAKWNFIEIPFSVICSQKYGVRYAYFTIYRNRKTFVGPRRYRTYNNHVWKDNKDGRWSGVDTSNETEVPEMPTPCDHQTLMAGDSPVMSGTMLAEDGSTVSPPSSSKDSVAQLQLNLQGLLSPLHGKYVFTWWDTESHIWATSDECKTEKKGDLIYGSCPHLTDFTLIVDGALNDPIECNEALSVTGYVANGLSIASLTFLFVIYTCAFIPNGPSIAKRDSVSLSYTTALLLFYIVFTIFANQKIAGYACSSVAAISYSLFLATIMMSIFKCLRIADQFRTGRACFQFLQKAPVFDSISFSVPFVASVLLLTLTDFFDRNDAFCWVRVDYIIYATIIPVSILVVNAALATFLVAYRLYSTSMRVKKSGKRVDYQLFSKLINILILQFNLGLPWVLQYFTIGFPQVTAWHYIFTIALGSQGTVLLLIFLYKKQRMRRNSRDNRAMMSVRTQTTRASYQSYRN